jgi:large subunit ribosomal protein L13
MATYFPKGNVVKRGWYIIDAQDQVLGRLATHAANLLTGKLKPDWVPYMDMGDHVIVINAEKVKLTGRKLEQKIYRHHSGYPGGLKSVTAKEMKQKRPVKMLEEAIRGMLPKNKLGRAMGKKLKVYAGTDHPHKAQKPEVIQVIR